MPVDPNKVAQFEQYLGQKKKNDLAASVAFAKQGDGSQFRRADIAASENGVPFTVAAQDVDRAESMSAPGPEENLDDLLRDHPRTAEWFSEPRRAALSWDDREMLKRMEDSDKVNTPINLAKQIGTSVSRVAGDLIEAGGRAAKEVEGVLNYAGMPTLKVQDGGLTWSTSPDGSFYKGIENIGKWASSGAENFYGAEAEFTIDRMLENPTPANVLGFIAETTAGSSAEMALSMVPGGAAMLAVATAERLAEERAKNNGEYEISMADVLKTLPTGLAVAYMEKYATKGLLGKLADQTEIDKLTGKVVGAELLKSFGRESATELVQENLEYATEAVGTEVGYSGEEVFKRSIGAVVAGGGLGLGGRAISLPAQMVQQRVEQETTNTIQSIMDQKGLDEQIDAIKSSKLFQESPERAGEFLRGLEGNTEIYITPEELIAASEEGLNVPQSLLEAARKSELTDVSTTVDQFALDVVTDEALLNRLRPHIKRTPNGMTQQEIQGRDVSAMDKLLLKARETQEIVDEADAIEKTIVDQLVATGRMDRTRARQSAAPLVSYIATKANELKLTPQEVMTRMNFRIDKAETPGKKATTKKATPAPVRTTNPGEILDQTVDKAPLIGPDTDVGTGVTEEGTIQENPNPRVRMHFTEVTKRVPELQRAAQQLKEGTMQPEEYARMVNQYKPVTPYDQAPAPNTTEEITGALTSNKRDKVGAPRNLGNGHQVGLRLDIPAYSNHGVWAVSVHEAAPGFAAGKAIGYDSVALVNNATLGSHEKAALNIAGGKPKATIAVVKGSWENISPEAAHELAQQAIDSPEWVQVGYDPERHSYFYDRKSMAPVVEGEQALQIGPLVLVKNPIYGDPDQFLYQDGEMDLAEMEGELSAMEQLLACTRAA